MNLEGKVVKVIEEKELNKLINEYEYIIKIIMAKYKIKSRDYDDALQEGRLGIVKAIHAFQEGKGANLLSFISLCIERQILSFLRNNNRKKNQIYKNTLSLDLNVSDIELFKNSVYKNAIDESITNQLYYEGLIAAAKSRMNHIESDIYTQYVDGYSILELSEQYKIPKKKIYVIIAKAKKKVEDIMNNY